VDDRSDGPRLRVRVRRQPDRWRSPPRPPRRTRRVASVRTTQADDTYVIRRRRPHKGWLSRTTFRRPGVAAHSRTVRAYEPAATQTPPLRCYRRGRLTDFDRLIWSTITAVVYDETIAKYRETCLNEGVLTPAPPKEGNYYVIVTINQSEMYNACLLRICNDGRIENRNRRIFLIKVYRTFDTGVTYLHGVHRPNGFSWMSLLCVHSTIMRIYDDRQQTSEIPPYVRTKKASSTYVRTFESRRVKSVADDDTLQRQCFKWK